MDLSFFQHFAYLIFFLAIIAYASLDGFDLGVGVLHLTARDDKERRIYLNAIGPVWDGNSVWIVVAGGVLFAAFPKAFSAIMSGFYLPFILLVSGFMFRGAAMEFRSKEPFPIWRKIWDVLFFASSLLVSLNLGMIFGRLIEGVPISPQGEFLREEFSFLTPYAFVIGLLNTAQFTLHGSIYLCMKTEGDLQKRVESFVPKLIGCFFFFWVIATGYTMIREPYMFQRFFSYPFLAVFAFLPLIAIASLARLERKKMYGLAFFVSAFSIATLIGLASIGIYPNLIHSTVDPELRSLTLFNSSSSFLTLRVIALISLFGIPLSILYLGYLYKTFLGKVHIDETSY